MPSSTDVVKNFELFRTNPNAIQKYAIELLENVSNNSYSISDPSNPFIFLLESSSMMASAAMNESQSRARELYPVLAIKPEDIYRHMSDRDYLNQFSVPGKITMSLVMSVTEIKNLAVKMPTQNYKKLTIPKNSIFSVTEYDFGIFYPIDIKVTAQDGLQIDYDTSEESPLKVLTDNKINFNYFYFNRENYINIDLPMEQYTLTSHKRPLNVSVGFNQYFDFSDYFYYCRVYTLKNNLWVEIETTHSKEVFNIEKITAQLTLLDNKILVNIPLLYFSEGRLGGEVRVDIYTTKGDINLNLGNFSQDNSSYQWRDLDNNNKNIYSSPLGKLAYFMMYSTSIVTGGSNGETFEQIKERVISSRSRRDVPIRFDELKVYLADRGYQLIKAIDNVTDRVMVASKKLPDYGSETLTISGSVESVKISQKQLSCSKITNHGNNYTFFPKGLYVLVDGLMEKLSDEEESKILSTNDVDLINLLNTGKYFYNPLHYSLDCEDDYLTFVPYMFTSPEIISRWKIGENTLAGYQIFSNQITIKYEEDGYLLEISTISNKETKQLDDESLFCQLSFYPQNETSRVFANGEMIGTEGGERVYRFKIESDFDINRENYVSVLNFTRTLNDTYRYKTALKGEYILTFSIDQTKAISSAANRSNLNGYLGHHLLPKEAQMLTVERLELFLGESMDILLSNSRLSVESKVYERYETDVPAVYDSNVYQRNEVGALVLQNDPDTNRRTPITLHSLGDPILDKDGNPIIKFKAGDIKLKNGNPVILEDRTNLYFLDILLINAIYMFSSEPSQKNITKTIPKMINDFLNNELSDIYNILLERTELFFTPKKTIGTIKVQVDKSEFITIESTQSINVDYYVNPVTNKDEKLKTTLEEAVKKDLLIWIDNDKLSMSDLISTVVANVGDSIEGVNIYWSGNMKDVDTFTLTDSTDAVAIKQQLKQNYDGTLEVEDSININFIEQGV